MMRKKKKILFWRQFKTREDSLPWPTEFVDASIPEEKRKLVAKLLQDGKIINSYRGMAACRLCGEMLGSQDKGDNDFIWPSRAEHYVLKHDVWIPAFDLMLARAKLDVHKKHDPFFDDKTKFVTVTQGMRGWFAVLVWWNTEHGGFWEPLNTGVGSYATPEEAEPEAKGWAEAEGLRFKPFTK